MDGGDYARLNTEPPVLHLSRGFCPAISWRQVLRPTPISSTSSTPFPIEEVAVTPLLAPDPPPTTTPTTYQADTTPTTTSDPPSATPTTSDRAIIEKSKEKGVEKDISGTSDPTSNDDIIEQLEKSVPYIVKAEKIDLVVGTTQTPVVVPEVIDEKETLKTGADDKEPEVEEQTSLKWYSTIAVLSGTLAPAGT